MAAAAAAAAAHLEQPSVSRSELSACWCPCPSYAVLPTSALDRTLLFVLTVCTYCQYCCESRKHISFCTACLATTFVAHYFAIDRPCHRPCSTMSCPASPLSVIARLWRHQTGVVSARNYFVLTAMTPLPSEVVSDCLPLHRTAAAASTSYAEATDATKAGQTKLRFYLAGRLVPSHYTIFQVVVCRCLRTVRPQRSCIFVFSVLAVILCLIHICMLPAVGMVHLTA